MAWEEAWDNHVSTWKAPLEGGGFDEHESVRLLNDREGPLQVNLDLRATFLVHSGIILNSATTSFQNNGKTANCEFLIRK